MTELSVFAGYKISDNRRHVNQKPAFDFALFLLAM